MCVKYTLCGILSLHMGVYVPACVLCVSRSPEGPICRLAGGCTEVQ